MNIPKSTISIFFIILIALNTGCSANRPFVIPDNAPNDMLNSPQPRYVKAKNDFADAFNQQFVLQGEQFVDLSRFIRYITDNPKEAYNADAFGEVANSSWFNNRNGQKRMTIEEIVKGANRGTGPDTGNDWTVVRAKSEGVTPGFTIIDSRGDKYVIKFDPVGFQGLNSASEIIGSRLFYASGYNVPQNYICYFDPKILKLGENVKLTDEKGRDRLMNEEDMKTIIAELERGSRGLIRATASKYVQGIPLGPFKYEKVRKDDYNDLIPHHHRRELRGLRVIAAWLNHIDSKSANSMDTYVTENGFSYVRHYLIDFGTILGSGGRGPQPKYRGYENEIDPHAMLIRMFTFGLYVPKWERVPNEVEFASVGRFYSEFFHPKKYKIIFPNPAYDNMTNLDAYWGAKIVMSFTDEQLKAVVDEALYPDPGASDYVLKVLKERRDITGRYWFEAVAPIDNFSLERNILKFEDLAVTSGLEDEGKSTYRYSLFKAGAKIIPEAVLGSGMEIEIPDPHAFNKVTPQKGCPENQWEVRISLKRPGSDEWSKTVSAFLESNEGKYKLIGIRRES